MTSTSDTRKLMSCTVAEFKASMGFVGGMSEQSDGTWSGPAGDGRALIRYQPQPGVKLGGLLEVPRAVISISIDGANPAERAAFLKRFELAFQRGGG